MSTIRFPNESDDYRRARDELIEAEAGLRAQSERVAAMRRGLPPGGPLKEDYEFDELIEREVCTTRFSELFAPDKDTLFVYSFMYAPDMETACPMCCCLLDGLDGEFSHVDEHINTAVVAKHDIGSIHALAKSRGWRNFRLLSSAGNSYNADYFGELDGRQMPAANVFVRGGDGVRHFWNSELVYAPMFEAGHMRHLDLIWPLWNLLDMTPDGRGGDWFPKLSYP